MSVHVFGIRHHGPGSARSLLRALEALAPDLVLVEGPPEADALLPLAVHAEMRPPVALLVYDPADPRRAVHYPFATFSPEWQAIRYAMGRGVPVRFCDLPQTHQFAPVEVVSAGPSIPSPTDGTAASEDGGSAASASAAALDGSDSADADPSADSTSGDSIDPSASADSAPADLRSAGPASADRIGRSASPDAVSAGAVDPSTSSIPASADPASADPASPDTGDASADPPSAEVADVDGGDADAPVHVREDPLSWLARAAGQPDGERWWEQLVEHRRGDEGLFQAVLEAMAALREELALPEPLREQQREAYMRQQIRAAEREGFARIAVVCGAWHAPALVRKAAVKDDAALLKGLPKTRLAVTWVPWTYGRLSFASGYGAGVTSPGWYDHLWATQEHDAEGVAIRWLTRAAQLLRDQDLSASTAQVIDAARLAGSVAALRGLALPGLAELNQAADAVFWGAARRRARRFR